MSVTRRLASQFESIAHDELAERGAEMSTKNLLEIVRSWLEIYEDVPPRNKAEVAVHDAIRFLENEYAFLISIDPLAKTH